MNEQMKKEIFYDKYDITNDSTWNQRDYANRN